jgi:hypothetical protein
LGEIAGMYADMTYITEEDPGEESLQKISLEVASFVESKGGKYKIIDDRGVAIDTAINEMGADSVILITGKGNETRQKRGIEYIDCPTDVEYTIKFFGGYLRKRVKGIDARVVNYGKEAVCYAFGGNECIFDALFVCDICFNCGNAVAFCVSLGKASVKGDNAVSETGKKTYRRTSHAACRACNKYIFHIILSIFKCVLLV